MRTWCQTSLHGLRRSARSHHLIQDMRPPSGDAANHVLATRERQVHQEMIVGHTDELIYAVEPGVEPVCAIVAGAIVDIHDDVLTLTAHTMSVSESEDRQRIRLRIPWTRRGTLHVNVKCCKNLNQT